MKAYLRALPAALLFAAAACDDLLTETPEDFLTPENFYQTPADAEAALISVYQPLLSGGAFANFLWQSLDTASDLGRVNGDEPSVETHLPGRLASTSESRNVTANWGPFYQSITRANLVIERVPQISMPAARQASLIGEAKFLRALDYFYLVRLFGDVPLVTSSEQDGLTISRTPTNEVYAQIVRDAEDAVKVLPTRWGAADAGRPTQGSALTLLTDVHLTRKEWQKAADAAKRVIDSKVYSLVPNYLNVFLPAFENGPEHVFFLQASGQTGETATGFLNMYYPRDLGIGQGGGFGVARPTEKQLKSYLPGDYRREVSYRDNGCNVRRKCVKFYPQVFKYRPTQITANARGDVDVPIYRYANVLLMYAEALNELGRPAEAVQLVNQIRARARRGTGAEDRKQPASYTGPLGKDILREVIFQERNWELAHEGRRWFDLTRRGEAYFMAQLRTDPEATGLEPTDMLWPIPQEEIDLNPALKQNPGY